MDTIPQSEAPNDIFSLSDEVLSERLEFIEEIGFGNWGSVWLCRPTPATASDGTIRPLGQKLAVKVVHRSKTSTTAARVRSLWNEMKIIKSLKSERHPSIIPFHSFIITPSYALITMSYLPTLVPVEVEESKARDWFHFLLSGVEFLHARGVVHNDIKPANILISHKNIPVLVDFGFAEKYDMSSDTAFHSNLSYGTPEYLSPERARGLPHDTRKSDIWSLGVTFFEIIIGRTPFEKSDGEQLNTKDDLEKYWELTLRGKWVGTWDFTKAMEKLLQRMMSPNADLRCTAKQAMVDPYWQTRKKDLSHKRASSSASSIVFEKDLDNTPSSRKCPKDNNETKVLKSPPGLDVFKDSRDDIPTPAAAAADHSRTLFKSKSQPRVTNTSKTQHGRKRAVPVADLSPIKASPNPSPVHPPINLHLNTPTKTPVSASTKAKENISTFNKLAASVVAADPNRGIPGRAPFGALNQNSRSINPRPTSVVSKKPSGHSHGAKAIKVLGELKAANTTNNGVNASYDFDASLVSSSTADKSRDSTNVKDRVRDWEREKQRLREMERLEDMERDRDNTYKRQKKEKRRQRETGNDEVVKERVEEVKVRNVGEEDSHHLDRLQQEVPEESSRLVDRKSASHLQIRIPSSSRQPIDNDADVEPRQEEPKMNDGDSEKGNTLSAVMSPVLPMFSTGPRLTQVFNISMDTPTPPARPTKAKGSFRHSIKASIDKTIEFCKSTSITSGRSTPARGFSFDLMRPLAKDNPGSGGKNGKEAWEIDDGPPSGVVSPLPVIKNAVENEKIAADARTDRVTIWMHNVEKLLEEAKQNFAAASAPKEVPLLALPPPLSRNTPANRSTRIPRRVLAASQIFQSDENGNITAMVDQSMASNNSGFLTANDILISSTPAPAVATKAVISTGAEVPVERKNQFQIPEINTPSRQKRRATVSISSPASKRPGGIVDTSPRKEKSKSQSNLLGMHIVPISVLEAEMNKTPPPPLTPRLSQVIDPNLFIAPPFRPSRDDLVDSPRPEVRQASFDELTSSPCLVEPYPQRFSHDVPMLDTPTRHRLEGVYDRFLMATSGVKRVGKGYQSENVAPVRNSGIGLGLTQNKSRAFHSTRRPMPPPVSSDDLLRKTASVDELGNWSNIEDIPDDSKEASVGFVRKAIMLMVPKGTASKRMSRIS